MTDTMETPAQAALHEPDIFEDEATAELHKQLLARLDDNLRAFFDREVNAGENSIANMSNEIAAYAGAHYYLSEIHNFHASELTYLLQFQNPLSIVADKFQIAGMDDYSDIMWDIFHEQGALQGGYALVSDAPTPGLAERIARLHGRLAENYEAFRREILGTSKDSVFYSAAEILPVQQAYAYFMHEHKYLESDVDFLLKFQNPLEVVSDKWVAGMGVTQIVDSIFNNHQWTLERGGYDLVAQEEAPPGVQTPAPAVSTEKPSVLQQLRKARAQAKENPAPRKDSPGKGHGPEL